MKGMSILIAGQEYPVRLTLRAVKMCIERYGSLSGMFEAIGADSDSVKAVDECLWLLKTMLDAGRRYNERSGLEAPTPPDEEALLDVLDLVTMRQALTSAIAGDSQRTVEADPPKNGEDAETAES